MRNPTLANAPLLAASLAAHKDSSTAVIANVMRRARSVIRTLRADDRCDPLAACRSIFMHRNDQTLDTSLELCPYLHIHIPSPDSQLFVIKLSALWTGRNDTLDIP